MIKFEFECFQSINSQIAFSLSEITSECLLVARLRMNVQHECHSDQTSA
jgi:hypothetical protein